MKARRLMGSTLDPQPAYALGRGLKTLTLRVAQQNINAMAVATALEGHAGVTRVYYPGLASHPDHAIAARQMSGFGGMVTIDVQGGQEAAFRVFDRFRVIQRATSLGGVESICSLPILSSHTGLSDEELAAAGVSRGMIRLSIGLEDAQDLDRGYRAGAVLGRPSGGGTDKGRASRGRERGGASRRRIRQLPVRQSVLREQSERPRGRRPRRFVLRAGGAPVLCLRAAGAPYFSPCFTSCRNSSTSSSIRWLIRDPS